MELILSQKEGEINEINNKENKTENGIISEKNLELSKEEINLDNNEKNNNNKNNLEQEDDIEILNINEMNYSTENKKKEKKERHKKYLNDLN